MNQLTNKKENKRIKVITGIRRSGKSYLLNDIYYNYLIFLGVSSKRIIRIKLDELSSVKYRNPLYLNEFINSSINNNDMHYIFIDEIQLVERIKNPYIDTENNYIGFYDILNELLSKDNVDVYVTGSNSKMLSRDALTEFRGRGNQIHISLLSFGKFSSINKKSFNEAYSEYQLYGGLPYVALLESEEDKINSFHRFLNYLLIQYFDGLVPNNSFVLVNQ